MKYTKCPSENPVIVKLCYECEACGYNVTLPSKPVSKDR